ncbi:MAG: cyclic nucleotide-binding domain-containing protein [Elusimicrobiota bacterium]|nr:MAG: cyclic nucleotide-binding domain-containing protein [Elusimicrobiota bacterium]
MSALKSFKRWFIDPAFSRKKQFLRSLEIFKELRDRDLGHLVQALHSRSYREGEVIFVEGDIGRALFILESGAVELTRPGPGGEAQVLYKLEPGDFFGEMALLESLPRTATATATEKTHLHLLYKSKLDSLLAGEPRIGVTIMSHLARLLSARLRRVTNDMKFIAPKHV